MAHLQSIGSTGTEVGDPIQPGRYQKAVDAAATGQGVEATCSVESVVAGGTEQFIVDLGANELLARELRTNYPTGAQDEATAALPDVAQVGRLQRGELKHTVVAALDIGLPAGVQVR